MNPSDLSKELKRIATAIEASKNPSKDLVIRDLNQIMVKVAATNDDVAAKALFEAELFKTIEQAKEFVAAVRKLDSTEKFKSNKPGEKFLKAFVSDEKSGGSEESDEDEG